LVLTLCYIAVVLDGFDTQVIGFAAPGLLADWGVTKADLAPALAMGLIGMTVGAAVSALAARFRTWLPLSPNLRRQGYVASRCR